MATEDLGTGYVTIQITDDRADASLDRLADRIEQKLDRAARLAGLRIERQINRAIRRVSPAYIEVAADFTRFNSMLRAQSDLSDIEFEVTAIPNVDRSEWKRIISEAVAGIEIKIKVIPDTTGFADAVRAIQVPPLRQEVEVDVDNDRLTRSLSGIGSAITSALGVIGKFAALASAFGLVGITAASATQSILAFTAALAPAAGILAALPAVIGGVVAANVALKLALSGVGDAFKAGLTGDAQAFEKSLEGLSPAAKAAAREVRGLKPEFDALKKLTQDEFFLPFQGQITETAKALGGPLKLGLSGISEEFGKAAKEALSFAASTEGVTNITEILTGTEAALFGLAPATRDVLQGFLAIGSSISVAFGDQFAGGLQTAGERLGGFLLRAAEGGQAVAWVDQALNTFAQLGDILGSLGGIISGVFQAAEASTGGFLANLQTVLGAFEEFVKSAQGQESLSNVFRTLAVVAAQLGPIINQVAVQLGAIAPLLTPLFLTIGPAIVTLIEGLGSVAQAVLPGVQTLFSGLSVAIQTIVSSGALEAIGTAFSAILTAIAPLLPVVGQLVAQLAAALAPVLTALAPVLGAVVGAVGQLLTALSPLFPVIGNLVAQLGPILTPIIQALGQQFTAFAPLVQTVANILSSVLGPILSILPSLIAPFLQQVTQLTAQFLPLFNDLLIQLQPSLTQLTAAVVQVAVALIPVISEVVRLSADLAGKLMPLLGPLIGLLAQVAAAFAGNVARVLTGVVVPALNAVASLLRGDFTGAFNSMKTAVGNALGFVKDQILALPRIILNAVGNFGSLLVSAGGDLINGMINGIKQKAGSLAASAKEVVSGAISAAKSALGINSPSKVFFVIGTQTGQGLVNGFNAMTSRVSDAAKDMAAAAVAPFRKLTVDGPTVNGFNSGAALAAITDPFGSGSDRGLTTVAVRRQAGSQSPGAGNGGPSIQNTFNITEVGNATATAERVVSRMVTAAGAFL